MCLLVLARNSHPDYPLVVVANRDEYHARESEIARWWPGQPGILAGRDRRAGGTWMGVDLTGRWGAVTNYRDGTPAPAPRSRGDLVPGFLSGNLEAAGYLEAVAGRANQYSGFSLLAGDHSGLYYYSNRDRGVRAVPDGIHTLSNHLLDTPWPKSELAHLKLNRLLHRSPLEIEDLMAVLADTAPFEDHELPATGVGIDMERALSPPFIPGEEYGTRCTTVLLIGRDNEIVFAEQNFGPNGVKGELVLQEFTRAGPA